MAHYRKIVLDDKEYEWVTSNAILKIKGLGLFEMKDLEYAYGVELENSAWGSLEYDDFYITPWGVRQVILDNTKGN